MAIRNAGQSPEAPERSNLTNDLDPAKQADRPPLVGKILQDQLATVARDPFDVRFTSPTSSNEVDPAGRFSVNFADGGHQSPLCYPY
jgi:hypothetical protein